MKSIKESIIGRKGYYSFDYNKIRTTLSSPNVHKKISKDTGVSEKAVALVCSTALKYQLSDISLKTFCSEWRDNAKSILIGFFDDYDAAENLSETGEIENSKYAAELNEPREIKIHNATLPSSGLHAVCMSIAEILGDIL
jgi:hypothetical protein